MKQRFDADIKSWEITPESVYRNRRRFLQGLAGGAAALAMGACGDRSADQPTRVVPPVAAAEPPDPVRPWLAERVAGAERMPRFSTDEEVAPFADATQYNNFYEFGTDKSDPSRYGDELVTKPWTVEVTGLAKGTGTYDFDELVRTHRLEERIYRLRCVEAWSMVIPWVGVPLATVLSALEPTGDAKYVGFETLEDREMFRGQRSRWSSIDWPYREGLRMDEAMNPLTLLAVGMYGRELPNQNGAPLRLVVPWKYGFKSIKSIVRIHFTERQPRTTWNMLQPGEYGFYANVNPEVSHPRWSQATERRLPSTLFAPNRIDTRKFNGYGEHVAHLYAGMDLAKFY